MVKTTLTREDIKRLREQLGMSQEEFAHKMGVAGTTVRRWEAGICKPIKLAQEKLQRLMREAKKKREDNG